MDRLRSPQFSSRVELLMKQHHVPGLSIGVRRDNVTMTAGYGFASFTTLDPCTENTLFDIASSSKVITGVAVGLLVEDDENYPEIQWTAAMSSLLPGDFVMPDDRYTDLVTVEDILSHRSGMAAHICSYMGSRASYPDDARSITRNLRNLPMAAPIRTRYLYCNMMYTVATHLVEEKTKQSFGDFLQQRIFKLLEMESTSLQPAAARSRGLADRIASGYYWDKAEGAYREFQPSDCPEGQGAGSIITSTNDFMKFIKALLNHEDPINESLYQGLVRTRTFKNPDGRRLKKHTTPAAYAAGVDVYYYRGHMVVMHDGMISGFASRFFLLPDLKYGCVIMGNASGAGSIGGILMRELIDELLQVPVEVQPSAKVTEKKIRRPKPQASGLLHGPQPRPNSKTQIKDTERTKGDIMPTDSLQELDLSKYIGSYCHAGYHSLVVEVRDKQLFIDANDRSMAFTLTFEHIREGTQFVSHLYDFWEGGDDHVDAEFVLEDGKAIKLGLRLESALKEKIWFDKMKET